MSNPELFEQLAASNPDGLWLLDAKGRTLYANPAMARLLGVPAAEMTEWSPFDVLDDQGRTDFQAHLDEAVAGAAGAENVEGLLHRADGTQVWALISWAPVLRSDGSAPTSWLHRITEYTERRRLTESLRAKKQQLSSAQAIAHIGSWEWSPATDELLWTEELYRIYRVDPATYRPGYESFLAFFHPADRARVEEAIGTALRGGVDELTWEARIIAGDGVERWVRGRGRVEFDQSGQARSMHGTAQDITDLQEASSEARWANQRLRAHLAFTEASNQATTMEQALEYTVANNSDGSGWQPVGMFERRGEDGQLRRSSVELEIDPGLASDAMQGRDLELAESAWRTGEPQAMPIPWAERTGALVAVPVTVDGAVTAVVEALVEDHEGALMSPALTTQIARQFSNVALREQIVHQLAAARDEAMVASALKSDFLATMSHEIRTPMNGVIGLTDLLIGTSLDRRQRHLAEGLRESGRTLLGVINDILDLSKIESGKLELECHDFDVRKVIEQAASVQGGAAAEKGIEVVLDLDPDVPTMLSGDSIRFGQVVSNLCSNAVKFTDRGEVNIGLEMAESGSTDVLIRVTVTDTGIGIPQDVRTTLFEPFTQADPSTTRRHGGTGLGLTICQRLVTALGGEVGIEDDGEVSGSRFWFTARFARAESSSARGLSGHPGFDGRSALLVEDNQTAAMVTSQMLHRWGMTVHVALDVDAGAASVRSASSGANQGASEVNAPYDVVLVDQTLPGGDASRFALEVGDLGHPGPVVILGSPQASWLPPDAGDAAVVQVSKPLRSAALRDALVQVWDLEGAQPDRAETQRAQTPGVRVLVVEDNPVNQLVATGFLETLGCQVEVADNGADALDRVLGGHGFALVLMDCRMPRMDGYEATRAIRADGRYADVPIVAMTASALAGERERCLAAGMDDFLTKPVDFAELARAIRRWVPSMRPEMTDPDLPSPTTPAQKPEPEPEPAILNLDRARELAELVKDGVSFFDRTRASFLTRVDAMVHQVRKAVESGDLPAAAAAAHALKGSAQNLGLERLGVSAAAVETAARAGGSPGTSGLETPLDGVDRSVSEAVRALNEDSDADDP